MNSGGFRGARGGMVSAQYLRGARRRGGNLLAGRPKILGEGGNENLYPPLDVKVTVFSSILQKNNESSPFHSSRIWRLNPSSCSLIIDLPRFLKAILAM